MGEGMGPQAEVVPLVRTLTSSRRNTRAGVHTGSGVRCAQGGRAEKLR